MKKSLVALAVLGAIAGVAQAQTAVVIYGSVDAGLVKQTGQSLSIGKRAYNTLGFKGTEELGSGLKAVFQAEMRYEPDTGTNETGAAGFQRPLFEGQTRVGLQGDFGLFRLGRGLTAFQESSTEFEPFHGIPSAGGFQTDLTVAGYTSDPLGQPGNSGTHFSNAAFYNSPEMGGLQINATVATRESNRGLALIGKGSTTAPQYGVDAEASATPYSISATYHNGPAAMMVATERNAVETRLWSVAGSVMASDALKLMGSYARQNQEHTTLFNTVTKAWVIGANYTMGAGKLLAGYGHKTNGALPRVKQFSIGYEYSLSKRTYLYVDAANKKGIVPHSINFLDLGINHTF